jgi:hypothetical protein
MNDMRRAPMTVQQHRGVLLPETIIGPPRKDGVCCGSCFLFSPVATEKDFEVPDALSRVVEAVRMGLERQGMKFGGEVAIIDGHVSGRFELGCGLCMLRPPEGTGRSSHQLTHWSWRCSGHARPPKTSGDQGHATSPSGQPASPKGSAAPSPTRREGGT